MYCIYLNLNKKLSFFVFKKYYLRIVALLLQIKIFFNKKI